MPKTRSGVGYVVRESTRAKRVIIKVRMSSDLEVVVPIGFALDRLPDILDRRTEWIDTQRKRFREMKRVFRPERITLDAIGQVWTVEYIGDARKGVSLKEGEGTYLTLRGQVDDLKLVVKALNAWTHKQARSALGKWLLNLSNELSIPFNKLTVRRQKTLWGSCSAKKNINLNRNLLFLPAAMARYVLIHELCHVDQLNHSGEFWDLLERHVENGKSMSAKTRQAASKVPDWATA